MGLFGRKKTAARQPNILVYGLTRIDEDGKARAAPLGVMPRLPEHVEAGFRNRLDPKTGNFISGEINGLSVVALCDSAGIVAISLIASSDADRLPGFKAMPADDLARFDGVFTHFPR